ncbi:hypothetical protein PQX77_012596 [Marasmius sp. AFHP31]|nr:hypothetical protein PQX77_012596 [Marasmius sp. AFHP31]
MKFSTSLIIVALASFAAAAPSALVEKDTIEARANCDWAYNGNTPTKRGPGVLYSCSKTSFASQVVTSYVCYVSGTSGPYCCSGNLVQTSDGPMVGGCY